ncbi:MAG: trehalose-6-phosphate synthase [Rugosibacter sp.]|nr:MAG: trehalose-6-phosphate synthase [Rugosibacter sp.]TBR08073.1 MAG: trehalose-6-phosphate synthase [Rugosibacter sp.]
MRLSLRFVIPLLITLGILAYAVVPLVDKLTLRWSMHDLDIRATLIANTIQEPLQDQAESIQPKKLLSLFKRVTDDERVYALGYCAGNAATMLATPSMPKTISCTDLDQFRTTGGTVLNGERGLLHVAIRSLSTGINSSGNLVLIHDMSFIERRSAESKIYVFYFFAGLALIVSILTVIIAQLSWRGWMQGIRSLMRGEGLLRQPGASIHVPELRPIARDLQRLVADLESEHRSRDESQISWTPESLRTILHGELSGKDVIVVSNREPYIHQHTGARIEVQRPASGLVTALEPIMRACSGIWIAHGGGSADRDTVDQHDRVAVPPDNPAYQLRRIWLTKEEEAGYYYGFANEGLWPLCHIAHVRPTFRSSDWAHYVTVNQKFADAVVKEAKTIDPVVLVQDYHLALVPRMLREKLPDATIITFWHIPWPNPESFAICPWREEIVAGLLGSSILGFHTQFHCNNFVDTVDRFMEARVDREALGVTLGGKKTLIRRYPISIDWPPEKALMAKPAEQCRQDIREQHSLPINQFIGIGVDRLDYTKGIIERFRAVERLYELKPEWIGRFTFIQIAAPTRSSIFEYKSHEELVIQTAAQINERFGGHGAPAIILKVEHHEPWQVYEHYRAAELCFVSSLHDGMNLVAKEFVAAREDQRGVLVLSQFTGAARELPEALTVNPYDADQCAAALHVALTMPLTEQRDRMRLMRGLVSEFNVYRWAGRMLLDAATMRRRIHLVEKSESLTISKGVGRSND